MQDRQKVCVISGGSQGIGLATAIRFARAGFQISICGRDPGRLDVAAQSIGEHLASPDDLFLLQTDLMEKSAAENFIGQSLERFQKIDVLVNNAATAPLSPLDEFADDSFESCVDLNIRNVFYLTRGAWRIMKKQNRGIIVNVSSQAAIDPFPGFSIYGASKAWLELFTVALASEGKPYGIRTYGIRPGAVETSMLRGLFADFPVDQTVLPGDVAETIWSVCQPAFENSSGQIVKVSRQ